MKFPYTVVHDGVLYRPGEDVPIEEEKPLIPSQDSIIESEPKQTPAVEPEKPKRGRKRK